MRRRLTSLVLSVVMVLTAVDFSVFAAEPVSETAVIEENDVSEEIREDEEGSQNEQILSTDEQYTETNTEKDIENEIESNKSDKDIVIDESDVIETEKDGENDTKGDQEETATEEVLLDADGNIASGVVDESYGHITWLIDANGKLMVTGTGDFSQSSSSGRAPWYNKHSFIKSAIINVTGMTDASYMFYGCSSLSSLDLSNFNTGNVTNMRSMFSGCSSLSSLDLSNFNTGDVTNMNYMFYDCSSLNSLNLNIFNTGNVTNMYGMFYYCDSLSSLDLSNFNTSSVTNMESMFYSCDSLSSLDLSNFNTSNVTNMSKMFSWCSSLNSLDLSNFNTGNVTNMENMFSSCSLSSLDLSNFNTGNVTNMKGMFSWCSSLSSLDLSNFNTSNVTNMLGMFSGCTGLSSLNLSNFNTNNVTNMSQMFMWCGELSSLDLNNFNTSNVTNMEHMFNNCSGLNSLDLSNFNIGNVTDTNNMFNACSSLKTIYTPKNVTQSVSLPALSNTEKWYCSDGTIVTELPQNLSYSIVLCRNYIPGQEDKRLRLTSVMYTYGTKTVDVLKAPYSIDIEHGKFKLTCSVDYPSNITGYRLYAGKYQIADSTTGTFENLDPNKLKNEELYIETIGAETSVKTRIYLNVVTKIPTIPSSIGFLGSGLAFNVDKDVPLIGGDSYKLNLPKLPVNAVYEAGKIKIGFNIKEKELYSYNSSDEGADTENKGETTKKKEGFWKKKIEDIQKELNTWNENNHKAKDIFKDMRGYMEKEDFAADIPGIKKSIKLEVIGYAEADWSDSFEKVQGELVIKIEGNKTSQKQMMIWKIPVTVNCEFTATGKMIGTVGYDFINAKWYGDSELSGKISIEPYAGVGVGTWASAGIYGMAEMGLNITLLSSIKPAGPSKWYLYGDAGVKAYFAKKEVGKIVLISTKALKNVSWLGEYVNDSGELLIYSNSENSVIRRKDGEWKPAYSAFYAYNLSALNDAQYLEETAEWNDCNAAVAYASENADHVLINNAYEAASPQVVTVGNTTLLFYIDNDTNRATPNQTLLKYRIYNNTTKTWGASKVALEDGTADFNPVVYSDGTDIYVTYLNSSTKYKESDDPDTEAYASSFGVSVLQYDMASQKFVNLGNVNKNDCYCYAPRLTMSDQGLCVAWVENSDNSLFGLTNNNRIMTSTLADGKFSAPVTVASGLKSVTSLTLGKNGMTDSLAYAVDTDNDLTTAEQEIFMTALSGNPVKCTEGIIENLKFAVLPGMTSSVLVCSANGALSYISGTSIIKLTDEGLMNDADFVIDGNRVLFLMNQNETRNVAAATYNNGEWNTVMLTSEADYVDSFTYDGNMFSYLVTQATKNDADDTWDTSSAIKTLGSIEQRDVALYDVSFEPENIKIGEKIPVMLTVCNEGINEQSNLGVTIKKSDGNGQVQNFVLDGKFAAGEVRECTIEMPLPDSIDSSCLYTVTIDVDETETNIENNSLQLDMTLTDVAVNTTYILETQEDTDTDTEKHIPMLEVTVANDSYVAAEGFISVKNQDGTTIFTSQTDEITAKDKKVYNIDLSENLPADGTAVLLTTEFITDAEEYYKSNNNDDKSVYRIENTQTEIEGISKGVAVTDFKESGYEYTGSQIKPSIFVYNNGELLKEGKDYTLSYENNVKVYNYYEGDDGFNAESSPKAVVSFQDAVTVNGENVTSVTRYFKIIPKDISGNDILCSNIESNETGDVQHPDVNVSVNGMLLVKNTDYTVTYPDEGEDAYKAEGIYNILISGIGNYSGSKYVTLTIAHKHLYDNNYNGDGEGHWRVCSCGEISNKESHVYSDWSITKDATDTESGIKERTCSLCAYKDVIIINQNGGEGPSEENSEWGDIVIEDRPVSVNDIPNGLWVGGISESGYSFIGEAIKPEMRVYDNKKLLAEKTDYTIAYKNNLNVGKATITVTGKGNYSGKETATFNILPANISGDDFSAEEFYVKVNQKAQYPIPELYYMGTKIKHKKDFTIKYANTSGIYAQAGEYSVTITGTGNYTGTREIKLTAVSTITKKSSVSIAKASLVGFEKSFPYTGKAHKQECTLYIKTSEGEKALTEGVDYTARYANNIKAGTATVTYSGKNGYTGKLKKTYKITPYNISDDYEAKITYENYFEYVYAKGGSKPKPVITFDQKVMKEGVDYTLSYKNNKEVYGKQTPCVVVNGKGSFKGKIPIYFTITPQDLSKMTLVSCDRVYKNKVGNHKIVPKLMDLDGKLLSAGKDFDKKNITYTFENDITLENGIEKKAGDPVKDTDILPADTQIRVTFGSGTGNNYTGTFTGVYRIVKADIKSAKVTIPNQTYTGKEIILDKSKITVTLSGKTLKPEDYEILQYTDNVKKGKASVTIKGNGNYGGTKTVKFNIGAKGFLWWKK